MNNGKPYLFQIDSDTIWSMD